LKPVIVYACTCIVMLVSL